MECHNEIDEGLQEEVLKYFITKCKLPVASWHEMYAGNALKNITRMTKSSGDIRTDYIGRHCVDVLDMWRGCSGWERACKTERNVVWT